MPFDHPPSYVSMEVLAQQRIAYRWDDWKASEEFQYNAGPLLESTTYIAPRGRIALAIGFYEWIIWRLRTASEDPIPFQIAEASWCALVDRQYMKYYEFDRALWVGPVRGPLWCAMTWLIPAVLMSDDDPDELESGLSYLARLAHHVIRPEGHLDTWTSLTVSRLRGVATSISDDPFDDLFGERKEERRGPSLPREVLDPSYSFTSGTTKQLIDRFLQAIDYVANPFLKSPAQLLHEGFRGMPYRVTTD